MTWTKHPLPVGQVNHSHHHERSNLNGISLPRSVLFSKELLVGLRSTGRFLRYVETRGVGICEIDIEIWELEYPCSFQVAVHQDQGGCRDFIQYTRPNNLFRIDLPEQPHYVKFPRTVSHHCRRLSSLSRSPTTWYSNPNTVYVVGHSESRGFPYDLKAKVRHSRRCFT